MKLILLAGGPRGGIDLFQSLLDNHDEILQFPGIIHINEKLKKILSHKSKEKIAQNFIKEYLSFFDSRKSIIERHNMLGDKKKQFYKVNTKDFIKRFILLSKKNYLFKDKLFQNLFLLHMAYNSINNRKKKKLLIINVHTLPYALNFEKLFKGVDYEIIHTIRHPLSAISSTVKNWLKFENGVHLKPKELYYNLESIVLGIQILNKLKKKMYIIQLENVHQKLDLVMLHFCKIYNLKFKKCLRKSTYHNLKWWGDKVSGKDLNGINKNFKISYNLDFFEDRDLGYFKYVLDDILNKYNYKIDISRKAMPHLRPLKCELISWKKTIKNKQIKHSFSIIYFYLKRILKFNKYFIKNITLPNTILLKKI